MEVNVHHAKTHLSTLIAAAEKGEEIVIARNVVAAVRFVPVQLPVKRFRRNMWSAGIGKIWISPDFDSKATEDEIADLFENTKDFD